MTKNSKHLAARTPRRKTAAGRVSTLAMAGAVAAGAFTLSAPAAQADSVWDRVAACESGGNWNINTGNGYYGGLQFSSSTWAGFGGTEFASRADLASKSQQIQVAQRTLATQGPGAWPTCSVEAGLTRSNGGASGGSSSAADTTESSSSSSSSSQAEAPAPSPQPSQSSSSSSSAPAPAAAPASSGPVTRFVSADIAAYVRSGPSYDSAIVDKAARGTQVSGPAVNGWVKIGEGRYIGNSVLSSSSVSTGSSASKGSASSTNSGSATRYVSADIRAYVRSGPSYDNAVIDTVERGTAVSGEWHNGWLKIGEGQYIGNTMLSTSSH